MPKNPQINKYSDKILTHKYFKNSKTLRPQLETYVKFEFQDLKFHIENHTQPHLGFLKYACTCLRLYESDQGATLVLQAHGLLLLPLATWFSPRVPHFPRPLLCTCFLLLVLCVTFKARCLPHLAIRSWLHACNSQLNAIATNDIHTCSFFSSLSDLRPPTFVQNHSLLGFSWD